MSIIASWMADEAIDLARETIVQLLKTRGTRQDFHLIVSKRIDDSYKILAEHSFGNAEICLQKYKPIAVAKTAMSARTGLDSRSVQLMHPEKLGWGDVIYWGSVIQGDIIVAGSGVQAYLDETITKIVMALSLGIIQYELDTKRQHAEKHGLSHYGG